MPNMTDDPSAFARVGEMLRAGKGDQAVSLARELRGSAAAGRYAESLLARARAMTAAGDHRGALSTLAERLLFLPDDVPALVSISAVLGADGRWAESGDAASLVLRQDPQCVEALVNRAVARQRTGDLDGADVDSLRALTAKQPSDEARVAAMLGRASVLQETARSAEALEILEHAVARWPESPMVVGAYLYGLHFPGHLTSGLIAQRHMEVAGRLMRGVRRATIPLRRKGGAIRVGMVSADFRDHPVTRFLTRWIGQLDRTKIEVIAYSDSTTVDARTLALRELVYGWREIGQLSDAAVAGQIERDEVDILIDLSGHLHTARLSLFAGGAAAIQLTYLGYPDTTGLHCFDGKLTDETLDPPGSEHLYTEPLVRLPVSAWCYDDDDLLPIATTAPQQRDGHLSFGLLNAPAKFSQPYLQAVGQIMHRLPQARLLVKAPGPVSRCGRFVDTVLAALDEQHVQESRVDFASRPASRAEYFQVFGRVDVALDTFPFCGHTTAFETLLMGVPMVAMLGDRHAGRWHASLMDACGISDLLAGDVSAYVSAAVEIAGDRARQAALRQALRGRLLAAGYCNGQKMAEKFTRVMLELHRSTPHGSVL
jgi:tetratricopeptide (TPR) repeat protein